MSTVNHIGVIGSGIMGSAIGQALLQHGYEVTIRDIEEEVLDEARERVVHGNYGLERAVEDGHLTETEKDEALSRLELTLDMETAVAEADLVIEAAPENLALKGKLFRQLDAATAGIPLYTNTSGFSITAVANAVEDPSRVAGMHFFNPAQIMSLVEIVETPRTSKAVIETGESLVEEMGKTSIVIDDAPGTYGFVANRCFGALRREAETIVEEGIATEQQVDTALVEGYNLPVGPFSFRGIGEEWE